MVFSGREALKFVVFILLVASVVFYVFVNRQHLMDNLQVGSSGRPEDTAGQPADGTFGLDLADSEVIPAAAPVGGDEESAPPEQDLFVEFRLERERARGQQVDLLRELLDHESLDQATRDQALKLWLNLTEDVAREADMENLIRAKGYADAIVVLAEDKATVMVKASSLTPQDVLRIADIVVRLAGLDYEDVTVMTKEG